MTQSSQRVHPSSAVLPTHGRRQNLSLVMQALYRTGPMSRAQLARHLGVTKVTASDLVAELIAAGRLVEAGPSESAGPGKRATLVDLDRGRLVSVAVDLSVPDRMEAALVDIDGRVLARVEGSADRPDEATPVSTDLVVRLVRQVLDLATGPVLGVGIGTPGIVGPDGVVRTAPNLGWSDVALRDIVAEATGLPVLVTNDADAAVHAELDDSAESQNLILVQVGRGVGCGLVVGGQRVVGAHGAAGEIGHVTVGTDGGEVCRCGKVGCLETWLSLPRLRAAAEDPDGGAAARRDAGERLGVALAPVVGVLDLSEVVLAGPPDLLAPLVPVLAETLSARLLTTTGLPLSVRLASSTKDLVLRGAAALVLWDQLGVT